MLLGNMLFGALGAIGQASDDAGTKKVIISAILIIVGITIVSLKR